MPQTNRRVKRQSNDTKTIQFLFLSYFSFVFLHNSTFEFRIQFISIFLSGETRKWKCSKQHTLGEWSLLNVAKGVSERKNTTKIYASQATNKMKKSADTFHSVSLFAWWFFSRNGNCFMRAHIFWTIFFSFRFSISMIFQMQKNEMKAAMREKEREKNLNGGRSKWTHLAFYANPRRSLRMFEVKHA